MFTKWLLAAILDVRKSLSIAFLAISDYYEISFLEIFDKMAAVGHFGCPKFTFDHISGHFRSIQNFLFYFFYKMAAGGHFRCPKITFDHISGHFRSIRHFNFFDYHWPFWMSQIHFRSQIWPIQIDFFSAAILDVRNSFLMAFLSISDPYGTFFVNFGWPAPILDVRKVLLNAFLAISDRYTTFFLLVLTKWPPAAILDGTTMSIIELVRDSWMSNGCVNFEERSINPSNVIALTTKFWLGGGGCGRGGGGRGGGAENIIFPKTYVSREYIITNHTPSV